MKKKYLLYALLLSFIVGCNFNNFNRMFEGQPYDEDTNQSTELKEQKQRNPFKQAYIDKYGTPKISGLSIPNNAPLSIKILTKRLKLTSVVEADVNNYFEHLYSNANVMEKVAGGVRNKELVQQRINRWSERFNTGNPFSAFTIWQINDKYGNQLKNPVFIGVVVLGGAPQANSAEPFFMIQEEKWNKGFGYEAVGAVIMFYGAELKKNGYLLANGETFDYIFATARIDNAASIKIQEKAGMVCYDTQTLYNDPIPRGLYRVSMSDLLD